MKFNFISILALAAIFTLSGCTSVGKKSENAAFANNLAINQLKEMPVWLQEAMARDLQVGNTSELKIDKLKVQKNIKGNIEAEDLSDDIFYYQIGIGSNVPVECYVALDYQGPANTLNSLISGHLTNIAQSYELPLKDRFNYDRDQGLVNNTPYLRVDTLYTVGTEEKSSIGLLKGAVAETDSSLQVCLHNEVGYSKAFLEVFDSFVAAFSERGNESEFYEAVYELEINGTAMGFSHDRFSVDNEGDVFTSTRTTISTPDDKITSSANDSLTTSWSRPNGDILNTQDYSVENGEVSLLLNLTYQKDHWQVEGEVQGKAVSLALEHTDYILSNYGLALATKHMQTTGKELIEDNMWFADANPAATQKVQIMKLNDNKRANYRIVMGVITMDSMIDENGIVKTVYVDQGPIQMKLNLLYSRGNPVLK